MNFYCLTLILILVAIASGQPQECNATFNNSTNNISSASSIQMPEHREANNSIQDSDNISLDFQVVEVSRDTSARFGIGKKEAAKQEMYRIAITNEGETRILNVLVLAEMEEGMKFESTRYYEDNRGRLNVTRKPLEFKRGSKTELTWDIGMLEPQEKKSILLGAYLKPGVNNTNITVSVAVYHPRKVQPNVIDCDYSKEQCPDWSIPM